MKMTEEEKIDHPMRRKIYCYGANEIYFMSNDEIVTKVWQFEPIKVTYENRED